MGEGRRGWGGPLSSGGGQRREEGGDSPPPGASCTPGSRASGSPPRPPPSSPPRCRASCFWSGHCVVPFGDESGARRRKPRPAAPGSSSPSGESAAPGRLPRVLPSPPEGAGAHCPGGFVRRPTSRGCDGPETGSARRTPGAGLVGEEPPPLGAGVLRLEWRTRVPGRGLNLPAGADLGAVCRSAQPFRARGQRPVGSGAQLPRFCRFGCSRAGCLSRSRLSGWYRLARLHRVDVNETRMEYKNHFISFVPFLPPRPSCFRNVLLGPESGYT